MGLFSWVLDFYWVPFHMYVSLFQWVCLLSYVWVSFDIFGGAQVRYEESMSLCIYTRLFSYVLVSFDKCMGLFSCVRVSFHKHFGSRLTHCEYIWERETRSLFICMGFFSHGCWFLLAHFGGAWIWYIEKLGLFSSIRVSFHICFGFFWHVLAVHE